MTEVTRESLAAARPDSEEWWERLITAYVPEELRGEARKQAAITLNERSGVALPSPAPEPPPKERDLYDPKRERWYRGTAEKVASYYDKGRSQWVTVAVEDEARSFLSKSEARESGGEP